MHLRERWSLHPCYHVYTGPYYYVYTGPCIPVTIYLFIYCHLYFPEFNAQMRCTGYEMAR